MLCSSICYLQLEGLMMRLLWGMAMVHQSKSKGECSLARQRCMRITRRKCGVLPAKLRVFLAPGGTSPKDPALAPYECLICRVTWCACPKHCTADDCSPDCSGEGGNLTDIIGGDQLQHCLANLTDLCSFLSFCASLSAFQVFFAVGTSTAMP